MLAECESERLLFFQDFVYAHLNEIVFYAHIRLVVVSTPHFNVLGYAPFLHSFVDILCFSYVSLPSILLKPLLLVAILSRPRGGC